MELAASAPRDAPLAAVVADYGTLPTDMLLDILLRLPAGEVRRLRLVCRAWRSLVSDPHFARAHASRHPAAQVIVLRRDADGAEVRAVDLHGNLIKGGIRIQRPMGRLSLHGDLLCASHGWELTCVVDMVTGAAVADVAVDYQTTFHMAVPYCVLGHVPATGEYKVLRIRAELLSRRPRTPCEVVTLGGSGDAGRWRWTPCPPANLRIRHFSGYLNVAVVAGLVYILEDDEPRLEAADSLVVFNLETEEWKPTTLKGPLTSNILAASVDEEDGRRHRRRFQLSRLGESLVVVYSSIKNGSTELWFLEGMELDETTAHWSKRYTLQRTQFDRTLALLDDGRILVCVEEFRASALKAYDPETCTWTDLATLTEDRVVGVHHGSLRCSNLQDARSSSSV